jgi:hypothetical protein
MTLLATPPTTAESQLPVRKGSNGWPTFAVQGALGCAGINVSQDGDFGAATKAAVMVFQLHHHLADDGVVGPATRSQLTAVVCKAVEKAKPSLPKGLAKGMALGEGGNNLAAVNWNISGGVDCGLWQFRVVGPPYARDSLRRAFMPLASGKAAMQRFLDARRNYMQSKYTWSAGNVERAGRCALLGHNWPVGAESQAKYGHVPNPTRAASWVPPGVRFPDGMPVVTCQQWAEFYSLSGPHGSGPIASSVTSWA